MMKLGNFGKSLILSTALLTACERPMQRIATKEAPKMEQVVNSLEVVSKDAAKASVYDCSSAWKKPGAVILGAYKKGYWNVIRKDAEVVNFNTPNVLREEALFESKNFKQDVGMFKTLSTFSDYERSDMTPQVVSKMNKKMHTFLTGDMTLMEKIKSLFTKTPSRRQQYDSSIKEFSALNSDKGAVVTVGEQRILMQKWADLFGKIQ